MKTLPKLWIPLVSLALLMPACRIQAQHRTNECETVLVYGTGTSNGGSKLRDGSVDPNFEGISANFPARPDVFVPTNVPAGWLVDSASTESQWIAPTVNPNNAVAGTYIYRLRFTIPCDGATVVGQIGRASCRERV